MPSPIGHALAGVAVSWSAERLPGSAGLKRPFPLAVTGLCAALAAAPDLDLVYPPIHRTVTHSIGATILVMIVAIVVTRWVTPSSAKAGHYVRWGLVFLCTAAYASHLLLDWLGADPSWPAGIQALWPFSDRWFISGWNLFPYIERRQMLSTTSILINIKAIAGEIAITGPIVAVLAWLRRQRQPLTSSQA